MTEREVFQGQCPVGSQRREQCAEEELEMLASERWKDRAGSTGQKCVKIVLHPRRCGRCIPRVCKVIPPELDHATGVMEP